MDPPNLDQPPRVGIVMNSDEQQQRDMRRLRLIAGSILALGGVWVVIQESMIGLLFIALGIWFWVEGLRGRP